MPPNPATELELEGVSTTSDVSELELEEWHGFCTEEPVTPSPERLGCGFLASPNDETDDHRAFEQDTRSARKREPLKKGRKGRLIGKPERKTKRKGKRLQTDLRSYRSLERSKRTPNTDDSAEIYELNSVTIDRDAAAFGSDNIGNLYFSSVRDALLTRLEKSWDEATGAYFRDKFEQTNGGRPLKKHNGNGNQYHSGMGTQIITIVRAHMRKVMKLPKTVPWSTLGLWLRLNRKRFINWDRTLSFDKLDAKTLHVVDLKKMLLVDVVDWTKDEIKFETPEVPLVIDTTGCALVKVRDLPQLYPQDMVDRVERSQNKTRLLKAALQHFPAPFPELSSSASTSTTLTATATTPRAKKRRLGGRK